MEAAVVEREDMQAATGQGQPDRMRHIHAYQWARALGSVAVVLLHALIAVQVAGNYNDLGELRIRIESSVALVATRWAVPVFFMMSGALMLDPARPMSWQKIGRHVWRMAFVLLTFGFAFCLVESSLEFGEFSPIVVLEAFEDLVCARSWDHMWFVYMLLGFYLITPALRPFVAQASERELRWTVVVMAVMLQGANTVRTLTGWDLWQVVRLPLNLTWYLLGYYAHTYLRLNRRFVVAGLLSLAIALVVKETQQAHWVGLPEHAFVIPYALMVFLAFEALLELPVAGHPLVALLSDYSFGIYIVHPIFQHLMVRLIDVALYPALAVDVGVTLIPLMLSIPTVWLLRKLPGMGDKL